MIILAELEPLDPVAGARKLLRAASANDDRVTGLNDQIWVPAIPADALPTLSIRLFKGDFDGSAEVSGGNIALLIDKYVEQGLEPHIRRYKWEGAPVRLYAGEMGQAWPWTLVHEGSISSFGAKGNRVDLSTKSDKEPFEADVLPAKYAGTGGIEGGDDLKNRPKPFLAGRCFNVEPVLINAVDNVYQFHGYGPIQAITKLYERASDFDGDTTAFVADYANYAALVAATIPAGRWGSCLAQGLVRLGAPAAGVITADVDGDKAGGVWRRKPGEIILRLAANAGVATGAIVSASFTALDTALAALPNQGRIGVFLTDQATVLDVVGSIAGTCNAQAGVSLLGKLFASRITIGSPTLTLDAQRRQQPAVVESQEESVSPPYSYMEMGWARSWRVHTEDEVASADISPPTTQYPSPVPDSAPIGHEYIDAEGMRYRNGLDIVTIDGDPITFGGEPLLASPWLDLQDKDITDARYQISVTPPAKQIIYCDAIGNQLPNQFPPRVLTPSVKMGIEDIRTRADVSYILEPDSAENVVATVNNTFDSPDKGRITVTSGNPGFLMLTVRVDTRDYGPFKISFERQIAPTASTGGVGAKLAEDSTIDTVINTSYSKMAGPLTVTVGTGEDALCTAPLTYSLGASVNGNAALIAKWRRSPAGAGTWTDIGTPVTGTTSYWYQSDFSGEVGAGDFNHTDVAPTPGDYDYELWGAMSNDPANGYIEVFSGTAKVQVQ